MAKTDTSSATSFETSDVEIPQRPTTTITLGSRTYKARAPKMQIWMNAGFVLERIEQAKAAQDRIDSDEVIPFPERKDLEATISNAPTPQEFHELFIDGREDHGRIRGGFLRRCLAPEDYVQVAAELDDEDSDLDLPELYEAAIALFAEFEGWFAQRAETMNLAVPKPSRGKNTKRKPAARRSTATK